MSHDPSYYAARAVEERRLAMASADAKVRAIHLEMALKYDALAGENGAAAPPVFTDEQRSDLTVGARLLLSDPL